VGINNEPYLERVFGEGYRLYKLRTPRYIGIPKEVGRWGLKI
jgi:hypothetical protein